MFYVYILLLSNKNLYKGSAGNLSVRIGEHKRGKVKSTKHYQPVRLIHYEGYILKSDAQRRERFLKTTEGRRLLNQQLRDILQRHGVLSSGEVPERSNGLAWKASVE